jgi:endonuclease-8
VPEGDTLHKIAAAMAPRLVGRALRRVSVDCRGLCWQGEQLPVRAVYAHGKHLILELEGAGALRVHLGMYGSWHRYRQGERWQTPASAARVVLDAGDQVFVCFRAREAELVPMRGVRPANLFLRLGADLVADALDVTELLRRAREFNSPDAAVEDVLLDQRVACGIGNVYKSELMFLHGIAPGRPLSRLHDALLTRLYLDARALLRRNLGGGRRRTRFIDDGRGRLWVYGRSGRGCLRCGALVQRCYGGERRRSIYFCAACQRD